MQEKIILEFMSKLNSTEDQPTAMQLCSYLHLVLDKYEIVRKIDSTESRLLSDIIEKYLYCKKTEGVKAGSLQQYKQTLVRLSKNINCDISNISINDIRLYASSIQEVYRQSTVRTAIEIIKSFFKWAHEEGYSSTNITSRLKNVKANKNLRKHLTITEVEKLRTACLTQRERALFEVFLSTGCRVSEIVDLKVNDLVDESIIIKGKGDKERVVYISEKARFHLKEYFESEKIESKDEYVFYSMKNKKTHIGVRRVEDIFSTIGKRANVKIYPHLLRHSFASLLLQNGASITTVQSLLGHDNVSTTQIYAKTTDRVVKSEYDTHCVV